MTWFRRDNRIKWVNVDEFSSMDQLVMHIIDNSKRKEEGSKLKQNINLRDVFLNKVRKENIGITFSNKWLSNKKVM